MNKNLENKILALTEHKIPFKSAKMIILCHNKGLSVEQFQNLRKQIKSEGIKIKVYKNTFLFHIFKETKFEGLNPLLKGPVIFTSAEKYDISLIKRLYKFQIQEKKIEFIGGFFEDKLVDKEYIEEVATLPSKEELLGGFIDLLQTPIMTIMNLLEVLSEKKAKKE